MQKVNFQNYLFKITCLLIVLVGPVILYGQTFKQVQDSVGIDHIFYHATFLGGGAVFFDYDNDGDDDLYITSGLDMDRFYENNGDGSFTDKTLSAGFVNTKIYYTMGVVAGDIDNDGYQDLFVTTDYSDFKSPGKNLLFKNLGNGTFIDIWTHDDPDANKQSSGATMLDINLDGLLDIYVTNYIKDTEFILDNNDKVIGYNHECYPNNLYVNVGNARFEDRTTAYNLDEKGCSLAVIASDYDNDGDPDIYVANDFGEFITPNKMYQNNGPAIEMTEVGSLKGSNIPMYGMGIAAGDIDQDLKIDYYISNYGKNAFLINGVDSFLESATLYGIDDTHFNGDSLLAIGWGTEFLDIDNDRDLDLYVGNGYILGPDFIPSDFYMNDKLFMNEEGTDFRDITDSAGIDNPFLSHGVSYSDYDNDGDLDILVVVLNFATEGTVHQTILFENQGTSENNWVQFTLEGTSVNRDAYGSKMFLYAGGKCVVQELTAGGSHASMHTNIMHFGLDTLTKVDSVIVFWTGGAKSDTFYDPEINIRHQLMESEILVVSKTTEFSVNELAVYPNPTSDLLRLKGLPEGIEIKDIKIFNIHGRVVEYTRLPYAELAVSTKSIVPGVYILRVESQEEVWTNKFIKV